MGISVTGFQETAQLRCTEITFQMQETGVHL